MPLDQALDRFVTLVACMCSGSFSVRNSDKLVGAVFSAREWGYSMSLWATENDVGMISKVKRKLRKLLSSHNIKYQAHQDTMEKNAMESSGRRAQSGVSSASSDEEMVAKRGPEQRQRPNRDRTATDEPPKPVFTESPLTVSRLPPRQSFLDVAALAKILISSVLVLVVAIYLTMPKRGL